jgi:hypothetical protein
MNPVSTFFFSTNTKTKNMWQMIVKILANMSELKKET